MDNHLKDLNERIEKLRLEYVSGTRDKTAVKLSGKALKYARKLYMEKMGYTNKLI